MTTGIVLCYIDNGTLFSDITEVNTFELPKLPEKSDSTPLWDWLTVFKSKSEDEMKEVATQNPYIKNVVATYANMSEEQADFLVALTRKRDQLDRIGEIEFIKDEAREEGRTEGLAEGRTEGLAEGRTEGLAEGRTEGLAEGRTEGLAEGRTEGRAEGICDTARGMKADGMDMHLISKYTGLTLEEIQNL